MLPTMNEQDTLGATLANEFGKNDFNTWDTTVNYSVRDDDLTDIINDTDRNVAIYIEDDGYNNWWALVASVLVLCTAAGNVLVCLAIYLERRLQNVTNYFLMSLAITDLLVAVLVMPLGILTLVRGKILNILLKLRKVFFK